MCGISGLISKNKNIYNYLFKSLLSIQHRGQDGSGTVVSNGSEIFNNKKIGLIDNNFNYNPGKIGLGHNRYRTVGECNLDSLQPCSRENIFLSHNGTINNIDTGVSDSQYLLDYFVEKYKKENQDIFQIIKDIFNKFQGGYSVIIMIPNTGLVYFRDPKGIRPLSLGCLGETYIIVSESCSINDIDFNFLRDINPGEAGIIDLDLNFCTKQLVKPNLNPCIFEYIYLARADSIMNKVSVVKSRMNMAIKFAEKIKKYNFYNEIDGVMAIPDTSNIFAVEIAKILEKPYIIGLIRNRYIGRTFIMPNDKSRDKIIKRKFSAIKESISGKNILVIDDSIVRGNTSKHIVKLLKKNGSGKIFMGSCAPPVKFENKFGIHIPTKTELISNEKTVEETREYLECEELIYQDLKDLIESVKKENPSINGFEKSIFDNSILSDKNIP